MIEMSTNMLSGSSPLRLRGTRVLITGGSSGIGFAVARRVVDAGGSVVLVGRNEAKLASAQIELGAAASILSVDVSDEIAVADALRGIGTLDHIVTAAAGSVRGTVVDV